MPYIEMLSKRDDVEHVWVIAPRLAYSERAAMGWPETWKNSTDKLTIKINPTDIEMPEGSFCFFSGITAFPEVFRWFKLSLNYNVKRGIITEAPYTYDKPLWMHRVKFLLKDYRYVKFVDYVFAIGEDCAEYYREWSKRWKVIPFLYCTEFNDNALLEHEPYGEYNDNFLSESLNICFVGSLDRRKNVKMLLEALSKIKSHMEIRATIVGDGPERMMLETQAKFLDENIKIEFRGALPMDEVQRIIANNDVLVLPSLHDGWGAVINEAMTLGTIPICSDKCGARVLIKNSGFGGIFEVNKPQALADLLSGFSKNKESIRQNRQSRIEWAKDNISPAAVSDYFISSL